MKIKIKRLQVLVLTILIQSVIATVCLNAQDTDPKQGSNRKFEKEIEKNLMYSKLLQQINSKRFVFEAEFGQGSDMLFVLVDSLFGAVQNGNRNNLQGRITQYEVQRNDKKKTLSVSIKMRAEMYSADVFLYIGTYGNGRATVKCDFPGNFSFDGNVVDIESATIYEGPSHFVH